MSVDLTAVTDATPRPPPPAQSPFWTPERVTALQRVTAALNGSMPPETLAALVSDQIVATLGAATCAFYTFASGATHAQVVVTRGWRDNFKSIFNKVQVSSWSPLGEALLTGAPVWLSSREEYRARFPEAEQAGRVDPVELSIACVPLVVDGRSTGALALSFPASDALDAGMREFLLFIAAQSGQALERERLREENERASGRLEVLAAVGERFSASVDYEETLRNVAAAAMPAVGDFGFFDLVEGESVRRIALAHEDPRRQAILEPTVWARSERRDLNLCALSSGEVGVHPDIDDAWLQKVAVAPAHLELMRSLAFQSMLTVPLRHHGELLGALTVFFVEGGRRHQLEDVRLATDIASRSAAAVVNARLFRDAQAAAKEARVAVELRDHFLAMASHELRTPLSTLEMGLHLLQRGLGPHQFHLPQKLFERVEQSRRQVDRLKRLVEQLLDVSQLAEGRLVMQRESLDLRALVRECGVRFIEFNERLTLRLPDTEVVGSWDGSRIDQVLTNLIANALKYGAGEPVTVTLEATEAVARILVEDRGIGVAAADHERIFGRFERSEAARNFGGLGLGLWIARQIVASHGGTISVESAAGMGSRFTVTLPRLSPR